MAPELCELRGHGLQAARKPDSVLDDHSSRRRVTAPLQQPTRKFRLVDRGQPELFCLGASGRYARARWKSAGAIPAYLVLLRVGFTMRRPLLAVRCALTAPFHPYPLRRARRSLARAPSASGRYIFCCTGRLCALKHTSRTLSGTLPCGVRTFLPLPNPCGPGGSDHPAACRLSVPRIETNRPAAEWLRWRAGFWAFAPAPSG